MIAPLLAFLSLARGRWLILSGRWAVHQRMQAVINGAPACPQAEQNAIKLFTDSVSVYPGAERAAV